MKMPTEFDNDILNYESGFGACYPDGTPITIRVYSLVFPPIGFFPFYGIGNGDYHGFYWPMGREDAPPLVAFSSHDVGALIPENSSIESLYHSLLAQSGDDKEYAARFRQLAIQANGKPPAEHDVRGLKSDDFSQLLSFDPKSPFYLCAAADVHVSNNEMEEAELNYRQSLDQLSEYVAAHFGLAYVLRRQRRGVEATVHLRQSLMGPSVFYGGSFWSNTSLPGSFRNDWQRKSLLWLRQAKTIPDSLGNDPFINAIHKLTFQTGLAENPDMDILRNITHQYATAGRYSDAVRTWQLLADRASYETSTFRERYNLNPSTYGAKLIELLALAGNQSRAKLLRHMLSIVDNPKDQRL